MRLLILLLPVLIWGAEKLDVNKLSDQQLENAFKIYAIAKEHDLADTMIAIAWQESRLGEIPLNLEDKASCGIHHIHIKTFLWQNGIKNNVRNRNYYCSKLISDIELSTQNAVKYFEYAKRKYKGDHRKAIVAYNAGFSKGNDKRAANYLSSVVANLEPANELTTMFRNIEQLEAEYQEFQTREIQKTQELQGIEFQVFSQATGNQ